MKINMMKRTLSTILTLSMLLGLFVCMPVSADADPTVKYLYFEDFEGEDQVVDKAPEGIYKDDPNNQYKYSDEVKSVMDASAAVIMNDNEHGKYLELIPVNTVEDKELSSMRAKVFLSEAVDKSDGTIVIEYDGLINIKSGDGNDGRKQIYATLTGQNKDRGTIYKTSELLKHKGSDVGNNDAFMEAVYLTDGTADNRWKGTVDGRKNDDGTLKNAYARMLYYYNDPIKNIASNESNAIKRTNNTWQHYKLELNLATGEQQLWIDGKVSEIWTDKELYASVRWEGYSVDAISFQNYTKSTGDTNDTNWKLDNIKVYKKDAAETSPFDGEITQDAATGVVTASFTSAMSETGIALYDADGNNVTKEVSLSEDGKAAEITPKVEETKGLYYVKVGTYAGGTAPAQTEKTVVLDWAMPPAAYLFCEDFEGENQVVGSAPAGIYSGMVNEAYNAESKTAINANFATVAKDETTSNTTKYLNFNPQDANSYKIRFYLPEAYKKDAGTIVLEYDAWISNNKNAYNGGKYVKYGRINTSDGAAQNDRQLLGYRGSDIANTLTSDEKSGNKHFDYLVKNDMQVVNDSTTDVAGAIKNSDKTSIIARNDAEWNSYKMEINLATGEVQVWVNGQISESWIDMQINKNIATAAWGSQALDGFSFETNYDKDDRYATNALTPFKLDNIKVYKKDAAEASPFANTEITSKGGTVTVGFTSAVNADDVSVYNADGVKQSGKVTVAEDGKTATFKPSEIMADGLYYVKLAKLADGTVTPQTERTFTYAPGKTLVEITMPENIEYTEGSEIAPTYTLTHTDGKSGKIKMIVAAYSGIMMTDAVVGEYEYTETDFTGEITPTPVLTLSEGADTIKAFAWKEDTLAPLGIEGFATSVAE